MKRRHMPARQSKRLFTRTARKVHKKNLVTVVRGGYRI